MEEINDQILSTEDEAQTESIFQNSTSRLQDRRFQVEIPLKSPNEFERLGESLPLPLALKRFYSLENRFKKNENQFIAYKDFIKEYIDLGHAKEVPLNPRNEEGNLRYFIPHHCVLREDSVTTKLRVVFDASMRTKSGFSLNDITLKGPIVQPELFQILCLFRIPKFVFTADIEKMFRQILIHPKHRFLQNIVWRDDSQSPLKCLELQTVTYGTKSAPFLSTRCLAALAESSITEFPFASAALKGHCYVDDILYGRESVEQLLEAHHQLTVLLESAGMKLHKWCSNSNMFLNKICSNEGFEIPEKYIISSENNSSKVLGLAWTPQQDNFTPKN